MKHFTLDLELYSGFLGKSLKDFKWTEIQSNLHFKKFILGFVYYSSYREAGFKATKVTYSDL